MCAMFKSNPDYDAENYFSSINSMAKRIVMDTVSLQATHAEKWKDLQYSDQDDLITQNFMKPAMTENQLNVSSSTEQNCFPKLKITPGQKIVVEEDNANRLRAGKSWRDEHSAPFMWESKSQLNLSYILQEIPPETPNVEEMKPEEVVAVDMKPEHEASETCDAESQNVKQQSFKMKEEVVKRSHSKKKIAPPIPIPVTAQKEVEPAAVRKEIKVEKMHSPVSDDENDGIPKTGFDFLDNW